MEKKSILFAANYMNLGGVEKSLLSLLKVLPADEFDIHLALMNGGGALFDKIPDNVTVHFIRPYGNAMKFLNHPVKETLRRIGRKEYRKALKDFAAYCSAKMRGTLHPLYAYLLRDDRELTDTEFDLAVNYAGPCEMLDYYIVRHIKAKHKALWIHFDLNHVFDRKKSSQMTHSDYDRVFCVSVDSLRIYRKRYPQFADKAELFPNIIDSEEVMTLAETPGIFTPLTGAINLVTVGRLEHIKGQDIALRALALLPPHYHWHFIGGEACGEAEKLKAMSRRLDVDSRAHFYGMQPNPYPFMKSADIYVQPSRSEGSPLTLAEIKLFGTPIVTTPFVSAPQLLQDCSDRTVIADAIDARALAQAIVKATEIARTPSKRHTDTDNNGHSPVDTIRGILN